MNKTIICHKCDGYRYINHLETGDYGNGLGWGRAWSEPCKECNGTGTVEVPMTNAEHIKEMNNEELAEFIHNTYFDGYEDGIFEEPYVIRDNSFMKDIKNKRMVRKDCYRE